MVNRVYFSPYQSSYLGGFYEALSRITEMFLGRQVSYQTTFFSAIVQGGISRLLLPWFLAEELIAIPFIQSRLDLVGPETISIDNELISDVFRIHLPESYERDEKYKDVLRLQSFLADLCTALRLNVGFMFPGSPPRPATFSGLLPPELLVPLSFLLNAVSTCSIPGPIPKHYVAKRDVAIFREVIESIWFEDFCRAHEALDDSTAPLDIVIPQIREKACFLLSNYDRAFRLSSLPAAILPFAPDVVEKSFGQLPGKLAQNFLALIQPFLEHKRRLVFYDSAPINDQILTATMFEVVSNPDPEEMMQRAKAYRRDHPKFFKEIPESEKEG